MSELLKPRLAVGLFYFKKADKHLFLNPKIPNWIVVNSNCAIILSKCDGDNTIKDISKLVGACLDDVVNLVNMSVSRGILDLDDLCIERDESVCDLKSSKHGLRIVHWKLTGACNLRCKYCYADSGIRTKVMSFDELCKISEQVSCVSPVVDYTLSGGEPLLHPDCLNFAEVLRSNGNSISLLTNGTLIDSSNARRISECTDRIKISLDGSTEEIHSITRGSGNFKKIISSIDMLVAKGGTVQVAMTVHRGNVHDISKMTSMFGNILVFQPMFQAGRGAEINDLALTGNEYYEALASVEGVSPMAAIGDVLESLRGRGVKRCALANSEISISENGDVYPCQLLAVPEFYAGNLFESSLQDIYYNSPSLLRVRNISVDTLEKCQDCPIRLLCAGGCRARDYYEIGTIDAVGSFCEYEQQAFLHGLFDSVVLDKNN